MPRSLGPGLEPDLGPMGRDRLIDLIDRLQRRLRAAAGYIELQEAIATSLLEQNRQLEEELHAERSVTDELHAQILDLRARVAPEDYPF